MRLAGSEGNVSVRVWEHPAPERIVVIAHGYGEHIGRYEHVAAALVERGAEVWGADHLGHGESDGERALIEDFEHIVDDLHAVVGAARERHPGTPVVLVGHSMGGLVATRYAQRFGAELAGLVLSAPTIGLTAAFAQGLEQPDAEAPPIDPAVLSRDAAVGEAYANDPLVWHGGFKRPTVEAFLAANEAVDAGQDLGELPLLYIHGEADQLVPLVLVKPAVERLAGTDFTEHIVPEARHETFNELEQDETIALVAEFAERVTSAS